MVERSIPKTFSDRPKDALVIVGDTETTEGLAEHVRDGDVLVIEATFLVRDASIARGYGHLTAVPRGEACRKAGCRKSARPV